MKNYYLRTINNYSDIVCVFDANTCFIPTDPANMDYQDYLAWVAEGNTPEPWENTNGPQ